MTTITASTILRSRNGHHGPVLSTLLLRYPRFIHAEFMTHRVFSRNAASSRAIPFEKQLSAMLADPAVPLVWGSNKPGMQAGAELGGSAREYAIQDWLQAMNEAALRATSLHERGAHKQIVNRVIEPFTHILTLVSATEWENFLELRDHEAAEPHMAMLARAIRHELDTAPVQNLLPGEWHLPFCAGVREASPPVLALSVGRCASTSYKTVEGFDMTAERAKALHDQFVSSRPQHASPLEHVAKADWPVAGNGWQHPSQHRNFVGFRQYRALVQ